MPALLPAPAGAGAAHDRGPEWEFLVECLTRHYTPREQVSTERWIFERIRLGANQSSDYAGEPLDLRRVPHARIIFDFLADPFAEELVIMKSSAAALSTTTIAACVHRLHDDPCNILYLISNMAEAIKLSKQVWQPFLRQIFGRDVDTEEQGNLHLKINGVEVFSGSPTESLLRNKQVGLIVEDESDTMDDTLIGGGQNLEVAQRERTKNTRGSKTIRLCTPLFKYDPARKNVSQPRTRIHRNFLRGDQREYRVPCPACRHMHPLREHDLHCYEYVNLLDGTTDLDAVVDGTFWRCPDCRHVVHDSSREKATMMNRGQWVPTNPKPESRGIWSAHHTDLCSLIGKATWGYIKKELIRTKGTDQEAAVRRSHLAEPEDLHDHGQLRDSSTIYRHCGAYKRGTCPIVPWHMLLTVDAQKDLERFPWMIQALTPLGDQYVIDWGECTHFDDLFLRSADGSQYHGLYVNPIPLDLPRTVAARHFPQGDVPSHVAITRALIDSGYRARSNQRDEGSGVEESVYDFCMRTFHAPEMRYLFVPVKGRAGQQITTLTVDSSVQHKGVVLPLHMYDDPAFKRDLYQIRLASDPQHPSPQAKARPRIHFPRADDITEDLIEQLTSETLRDKEFKLPSGRKEFRRVWDNDRPNDLGDCLKWGGVAYTLLASRLLQQQAPAS